VPFRDGFLNTQVSPLTAQAVSPPPPIRFGGRCD
jgi:hypothetical protein